MTLQDLILLVTGVNLLVCLLILFRLGSINRELSKLKHKRFYQRTGKKRGRPAKNKGLPI